MLERTAVPPNSCILALSIITYSKLERMMLLGECQLEESIGAWPSHSTIPSCSLYWKYSLDSYYHLYLLLSSWYIQQIIG